MPIYTFDDYLASQRQIVSFWNQTTNTLGSNTYWYPRTTSMNTPTGNNLSAGAAPSGSMYSCTYSGGQNLGFPYLNAFAGGATGVISRLRWSKDITATAGTSRARVVDYIWNGAATLSALATINFTTFPTASVLSRSTTGNGDGNEIWFLASPATAPVASATTLTVTYTNSAGVGGRTTGTVTILAGNWTQPLPLQAGDTGVRSIETVVVGGTADTSTGGRVALIRRIAEFPMSTAITSQQYVFNELPYSVEFASGACLDFWSMGSSAVSFDAQLEIASK